MAEADARRNTKELLIFIGIGGLVAAGAGMFRLWSGISTVTLLVLWLLLLMFSARRFGKHGLWLLLTLPLIVIAPFLVLWVVIGLCYLGVSPNGCF